MIEVVEQCAEIVHISHPFPTEFIEESARICYQSAAKTGVGTDKKMVENLLKSGHGMPFEFIDVVADLLTDRTVSHQIVRHRMSSILQESQRYVRYDDENIAFIKPVGYDRDHPGWQVWEQQMEFAFAGYLEMLSHGLKPQAARKVLPSSVATRVRVKANLREWMLIFSLRMSPAADPQMNDLVTGLYRQFSTVIPEVFAPIQ